MYNASLVVTVGVILGFVSCAKSNTSSLRMTQGDQVNGSSLGHVSSSNDECELPSSLGSTTENENYESFGGDESFALAGASSGKAGDPYKPVKPAGDKLIGDLAGGPSGSAILPDSFKASACNTGLWNTSRVSAVTIMSNFQECFYTAKRKRCLVVKREDLIAECAAQYDEDVRSSKLSQECSAYMKQPSTRRYLENAVSSQWLGEASTAQVDF
jgi:hypothetical protein